MRKHILPLTATLAAALVITGAAGASAATTAARTTGPVIGTKVAAGYQASGRDFRYITGLLTVPDDGFSRYDGGLYPQEYIELSNGSALLNLGIDPGDEYARAGIESCQVAHNVSGYNCSGTQEWVAFVETWNNTLGGGIFRHYVPLDAVSPGDGVFFSIYDNIAGNELQFVVKPPTPAGGAPVGGSTYKTQAYGLTADHASALDDFTDASGGVPLSLPPIISQFQVNSFLQVAITTGNGQRGSFAGPWTTSEVEATSNGNAYPLGTVRVAPDALYSDGAKANGAVRASDATDINAR